MNARYSVHGSRRLLGFGAAGTLAGIALSVVDVPAASVLTVASLLTLIVGLHRFGRTGADPPTPGRGFCRPGPDGARQDRARP